MMKLGRADEDPHEFVLHGRAGPVYRRCIVHQSNLYSASRFLSLHEGLAFCTGIQPLWEPPECTHRDCFTIDEIYRKDVKRSYSVALTI